jgi:alcohol dehydrogenase (NADP+)
VLTPTDAKAADAKALGADAFLASTDGVAMKRAESRFDLINDTGPVKQDVTSYLLLPDVDGTLTLIGQVGPLDEPKTVPLIRGRRRVAGSLIGSIRETQGMFDFCADKNILTEREMIRMGQISDACKRMERSDVRYRFVIDMASLQAYPLPVTPFGWTAPDDIRPGATELQLKQTYHPRTLRDRKDS